MRSRRLSRPATLVRHAETVLRWRLRPLVISWFARLYSDSAVWNNRTSWLGVPTLKVPSDLWVLQELVVRIRPDLFIETGTHSGGSALFLATVMDATGHGEIITIDVKERPGRPAHPRIEYVSGSSVEPDVLQLVRQRAAAAARVMVALDSDHSFEHVLAELSAYAPLVTADSYLIVEDTSLDEERYGPGPRAAVARFLAADDRFLVDAECEKFMHTGNPSGFLKRVG